MKNKNRIFLNVAAIFTILLSVLAAAILFMWSLDNVISSDIVRILDNAATHSAAFFRERFGNDLNSLKYAAAWAGENSKAMDFGQIAEKLVEKAGKNHFTSIFIADLTGKIYYPGGVRTAAAEEKEYLSQVSANNVILLESPDPAGEERWIAALAPVTSQGNVIGAVIGHYAAEDFCELLDSSLYPYGENIQIIHRSGEALQPSDPSFQNALTFLETSLPGNRSETAEMKRRMQDGKSGSFLGKIDGKKTVIHYAPAGINDWYLFSMTPTHAVAFCAVHFLRKSIFLIILIPSVLIFIILSLLFQQQKNRLKLQKLRKELSVLYRTLPGGVLHCKNDESLTVVYASKSFFYFLGYSKQEFEERYHNQVIHVFHPDDYEKIKANSAFLLTYGSVLADEYRILCADGAIKWIWLNAKLAEDADGEKSFYTTFADITPLKEAQENLLVNQGLYDIILDQTQDSIFEWNIPEHTVYFSKNFLKKFGYEPATSNFPECILPCDKIPKNDMDSFRNVCRQLIDGEKVVSGEFRIKKADGSFLWCSVTATAILDKDGQSYKAVGILSDIDTQKRTLQSVKEYAQKDSLTGLYNKGITEHHIRTYIEQDGSPAALIVIDIDNFKQVNDTLGHLYGDTALKEIANAIKSLFRSTDIIGRIGGDEFIVFLQHVTDEQLVHNKVHKITEIFQNRFEQTNINYKMTVSVGIAFFPKDADNFPELFDKADIALYYAKNHGKNQYAVYCEKVEEANSLRSQKKNGLRLY